MMTSGQLWVSRRLDDIIVMVEEAAGDIDTQDYPNFDSWMMDVFDSALNRIDNKDYSSENSFLDRYNSVLSAMEDMFKDQLEDFYLSQKDEEMINESEVYKNIESLIKHWKIQLKKGKQIRFEKDDLEFWGITKNHDIRRTQILFQELVGDEDFAKKVIKNLMNKKFSTKDFDSRIVGGYDFEWTITHMEYRDYDFFLWGKTLPGGTVSMMDDRNLTLVEALEDSDIAYEIQDEVNDVVQDCMNSIILPMTGYEVEIPMVYIDEE